MTWREQAKELGIPLFQRKKVAVLADIEAILHPPQKKVLIKGRIAKEICDKALRDYAIEQGIDGNEPIATERWSLNCRRRGIMFKGTEMKIDQREKVSTKEPIVEKIETQESENAEPETEAEATEPGNGEDTGSTEVL